jgi:prepilin-type processing-associated H-X9-DG protein
MLGETVRRPDQTLAVYMLIAASAALWVTACGQDGPNPHLRTFACDRGFRSSDWANESTREMTAQSIDRCGWFDRTTRHETIRLLGKPDDGRSQSVSYLTGYDDEVLGSYSYLNIAFADGRVRDIDATYGE